MKPSIGRVVVYTQLVSETPHNGSREHPAIINRVWGADETPCVNLTVFFDCGPVECRTSVLHKSRAGDAANSSWDWPAKVE